MDLLDRIVDDWESVKELANEELEQLITFHYFIGRSSQTYDRCIMFQNELIIRLLKDNT